MRAAVITETGPPSVLHLREVPDPPLHDDGVLVGVEVISIEGGDTLHRGAGVMASTPHIVGYQCAGEIIEVGPHVTDRHVGQRVVAVMPHGSHAELVSVPATSTWPVPDGADLHEIACVPIAFGTADDCLFEFGDLVRGETVLIHAGSGGLGLAAIQLARRAGATVITTAGGPEKVERLRRFGVDHAIDYRAAEFVDEVRRFTDGRGVDLVVDPVGSTLPGSMRSLAYRGRISYVGNAGRSQQQVSLSPLMLGNHRITGVFLGRELQAGTRAHENITRLVDEVARGELHVVIDRAFPLSEAAAAHRLIEDRGAFGRVLLIP